MVAGLRWRASSRQKGNRAISRARCVPTLAAKRIATSARKQEEWCAARTTTPAGASALYRDAMVLEQHTYLRLGCRREVGVKGRKTANCGVERVSWAFKLDGCVHHTCFPTSCSCLFIKVVNALTSWTALLTSQRPLAENDASQLNTTEHDGNNGSKSERRGVGVSFVAAGVDAQSTAERAHLHLLLLVRSSETHTRSTCRRRSEERRPKLRPKCHLPLPRPPLRLTQYRPLPQQLLLPPRP